MLYPKLLRLVAVLFYAVSLGILALAAQEQPYPMAQALQNAPLPPADRYAIAQRFQLNVAATPQAHELAQIGDVNTFFVVNTAENRRYTVEATVLASSAHALVWVEQGVGVTTESAQAFAAAFDEQVAIPGYALWAMEPFPGVDGDPRVSLLFTQQTSPNVLGYFATLDTYPRTVVPSSNEREMLIFNVGRVGPDRPTTLSVAAHEFQHMLHENVDADEVAWVDEGFSMLTEHLLGWPDNQWALSAFFNAPSTQLTTFGIGPDVSADYGASLAFLLYNYERFGQGFINTLHAEPANGLAGFRDVLAQFSDQPMDELYADWVVANIVRDAELGYGYNSLPDGISATAITQTVTSYPATLQRSLNQYGTDYYALQGVPATLQIALDVPQTVDLLPTDASSGSWTWYSQRGDSINPRLTRPFDLREVTAAELTWQIWYDLEPDWDYAYVSVSVDGGQTWQLQATELTTTQNPNGRGLGIGYTGRSNGWRTDRLVLDAFAGREILVRFELLTDAAVNYPGVALDDLHLDAIGYVSDIEADGGGWQAEGWIRSDNRLPQQMWLQVIQQMPADVEVTRWLADGPSTHTIDLLPDASAVTLALSPFAPMTTEPTRYRLTLR